MSMKMLTLLQFSEAFAAYFFVTVMLPAFVLRGKVKTERLAVRFLIYFTIGNFFVINLVYILQLLKVSYRITLILFTALPTLIIWQQIRKLEIKGKLLFGIETTLRLARGQMGIKTFSLKIGRWGKEKLYHVGGWIKKNIINNLVDWMLTLGLTFILFWQYGQNLINNYGYGASDILVHNYWINYLGKNQVFVSGVYPYGFHCVLYYIHEVFGMDTYVLLRVFWFVQTLMLHYVLLAFLKACCKSRYAAYIGVGIFACASFFPEGTYSRYYSSLPQEFGILFILPAIYFAFAFFQKDLEKKKANGLLASFAMSFSMTFSVHFYGTMIAGLFCVGIAIGYGFRFFQKKYFGKVIATFIISIIVAILPLGVAFAMGTPAHGSIAWGLSVMSGEDAESVEEKAEESTHIAPQETLEEDSEQQEAPSDIQEEDEIVQESGKEPIFQRLKEKLQISVKKIVSILDSYALEKGNIYFRNSLYICFGIIVIFALLFFLMKRFDYGAMLLSIACFMAMLAILLSSGALGIPPLMDENRGRVYFTYMLPLLWSLSVDAVLYFAFGKEIASDKKIEKKVRQVLLNITSFVILGAVAYVMYNQGFIREPLEVKGFQTNEAVTCLTNIIHDNKDQTWTILSANDELRMGEDHGYHYESIDLLQRMEWVGENGQIIIPTEKVYIFIEKVPLDYSETYDKSGQRISKEGAKRELPRSSGISMYQGENRFIVMSRMYYWAQCFMQKYKNEMKVYFENENFVCYCLEQNPYRLFNFSIDYGYNMGNLK